jgi:hypothetical protein
MSAPGEVCEFSPGLAVDNVMERFLLAFILLTFMAACAAVAQSPGGRSNNLRDCLAGFGGCNRSLLSPDQAKQVDEFRHDYNLWQCLSGYSCDRSLLK